MNVMVRIPVPAEPVSGKDGARYHVPASAVSRIVNRLLNADERLLILHAPAGYGKRAVIAGLEQRLLAEGQGYMHIPDRLSDERSRKPRRCAPPDWLIIHCADGDVQKALSQAALKIKSDTFQRILITTARICAGADELASRGLVLGPADLSLEAAEIAEHFLHRSGREISEHERRELKLLTGGWPVAVDACVLQAAQASDAGPGNLAELIPFDRMRRFFCAKVLSRLPEALREFLQDVSDLDSATPEMISAMMKAPVDDVLRAGVDEYALLERVGGEDDRYVLNPLMRRILVHLGAGRNDKKNRERMKRAAQWSEAHGYWHDAVEYYLKSGETELAATLLSRSGPRILQLTGDTPRTLRWIDTLEARGIELTTSLRLWRTWALTLAFRLEEAVANLRIAEAQLQALPNPADQSFAERLWVGIAARRGDLELVQRKSEQWLNTWPESEPQNAAGVCILLALAKGYQHDELGQRRLLMKAREYAVRCGNDAAHLWILGIEALAELEAGRAGLAVELSERAMETAARLSGTNTPLYALMSVISSRMHLEIGDIAQAAARLGQGYLMSRQYALPETNQAAKLVLAAVSEHKSGCDAAISTLHQFSEAGEQNVDFCNQLATMVLIRHGRIAEARLRFEILKEGRASSDAGAAGFDFKILEATLLLAERKYAEAAKRVSPLLVHADSHGRTRKVVALLAMRAASEWHGGQEAVAFRTFARAVSAASAGGLMNTLLELGWLLKEIIAQIPDAELGFSREAQFMSDLRVRMGVESVRDIGNDIPEVVAKLTGREREILSWLDSSLKISQIARNISVGETTLKWHLRNIYDKLSVHNRSGAVAMARRYALIE